VTGDHCIGDGVGMALVGVAGLIDAAQQLHAAALLDDMCGLVCGGVKIRRAVERHRVADGERASTERLRGLGRRGALMSCHARDVMPAEAALDRIAVWKLAPTACDGLARDLEWRAGAPERWLACRPPLARFGLLRCAQP
jgi:hypothetical protein